MHPKEEPGFGSQESPSPVAEPRCWLVVCQAAISYQLSNHPSISQYENISHLPPHALHAPPLYCRHCAMAPRRWSNLKDKQKATNSQGDSTHSGTSDRSLSQSVVKSKESSTHWTVQDEDALIELALSSKLMMGNGRNFRDTFWNEVATNFPPPTNGNPKTTKSYKEKWKRVIFLLLPYLHILLIRIFIDKRYLWCCR